MMEVGGFIILDLFLTWQEGMGGQTQIHSSGGSGNAGFTYS